MNISAVILTKNEEKNIIGCIESLEFCTEIIVIDDHSIDRTLEEIQKLKVKRQNFKLKIKIIERELKGDFAAQRNFGMKEATGEWILFADADERITDELKNNIIRAVGADHRSDRAFNAFYIKRRDFWWGKELRHGETAKTRNKGIVRLVKKGSGIFLGDVHEVFYTATAIGTLDGYLNHYPHPTVKDFINSVNTYSSIRAEELYDQGKTANLFQIIFYPLIKFKLNYFLYGGFLDGPAGFAYCFFMSFHSFLVRAKLYQLNRIATNK